MSEQPWEMVRENYVAQEMADRPPPRPGKPSALTLGSRADQEGRMWFRLAHEHAVVDALRRGEQVPDEVMADYPNLNKVERRQ